MAYLDESQARQKTATAKLFRWVFWCGFFALILVIGGMVGCPSYNVYLQKKQGQAILAHAQSSREVAVAEARAKMESATLLAQADTIRAHGIARSNQIIGESLKDNEAYLHWLWIDQLKDTKDQIIYIPSTNLGLPILEANRLPKQQAQP